MKILEVLTKKRKTGNLGEELASKYLKKEGYKIRERNYVALGHEIDIIAETKDTVAFVEVKTRTVGYESKYEARPASSVTPEKQRKIITTAKYYLAGFRPHKYVNLDIVEVYLNQDGTSNKIIHIKNAFNWNTAHDRKVHR